MEYVTYRRLSDISDEKRAFVVPKLGSSSVCLRYIFLEPYAINKMSRYTECGISKFSIIPFWKICACRSPHPI